MKKKEKYLVSPNINDKSLITELKGIDENGKKIKSKVINEKFYQWNDPGTEVRTECYLGSTVSFNIKSFKISFNYFNTFFKFVKLSDSLTYIPIYFK